MISKYYLTLEVYSLSKNVLLIHPFRDNLNNSISIYLLLIYLEKGDSSLVLDLDDQMESVRANINYLQDNILECQQNILQMEQAGGLYILESPFF